MFREDLRRARLLGRDLGSECRQRFFSPGEPARQRGGDLRVDGQLGVRLVLRARAVLGPGEARLQADGLARPGQGRETCPPLFARPSDHELSSPSDTTRPSGSSGVATPPGAGTRVIPPPARLRAAASRCSAARCSDSLVARSASVEGIDVMHPLSRNSAIRNRCVASAICGAEGAGGHFTASPPRRAAVSWPQCPPHQRGVRR